MISVRIWRLSPLVVLFWPFCEKLWATSKMPKALGEGSLIVTHGLKLEAEQPHSACGIPVRFSWVRSQSTLHTLRALCVWYSIAVLHTIELVTVFTWSIESWQETLFTNPELSLTPLMLGALYSRSKFVTCTFLPYPLSFRWAAFTVKSRV